MGPIIVVKNKQVASLAEMNRLALKRIFDKDGMTYPEEVMLDYSIEQWPKKVDITPEERKQLKVIVDALIANEDGKFHELKKAMKDHKLDYRKVYQNDLSSVNL